MKIYAVRLTEGMDLKIEIQKIVEEKQIKAGIILSSVGCISKARFRVADGVSVKGIEKNLEILSLNGTLSQKGIHLHISFSDLDGISFGGHLVEGNIINTTCELVIGILEDYKFDRWMDSNTGYEELVIETQES
ncbi:PPC domain-containing DNA-binding protein [Psychrilyobacter atlanticus]|uniref:PPC domain-containing DNA-binding protein n=1 Tax=Psychrilyobacter atlanticus TaxID=271091 RepID=UPI0003F834CF|nr:PPC domain-containing DNA-binding protein [Psychrilyobacter atlanticus]